MAYIPTALELAVSFGVDDDSKKYLARFGNRFDLFLTAQKLVNGMRPSPARETVLVRPPSLPRFAFQSRAR